MWQTSGMKGRPIVALVMLACGVVAPIPARAASCLSVYLDYCGHDQNSLYEGRLLQLDADECCTHEAVFELTGWMSGDRDEFRAGQIIQAFGPRYWIWPSETPGARYLLWMERGLPRHGVPLNDNCTFARHPVDATLEELATAVSEPDYDACVEALAALGVEEGACSNPVARDGGTADAPASDGGVDQADSGEAGVWSFDASSPADGGAAGEYISCVTREDPEAGTPVESDAGVDATGTQSSCACTQGHSPRPSGWLLIGTIFVLVWRRVRW